jgi:ribonuclease-3
MGEQIIEAPGEFDKRLSLEFSDSLLLHRALTHRSYLNENPQAIEDNERLEFLGDAVLDFVVGAWLYVHFPEKSEGELTRLRAALVRTERLAIFAEDVELGRAIRLGKGEEESGGRTRPAMLCAAFEALMGALYLDAGIERVTDFVEPLLDRAIVDIQREHGDIDSKSQLQEWVQGQGYSAPAYKIVNESGPDHDKEFVVEVTVNGEAISRGEGKNKQKASKVAARRALDILEIVEQNE